jgi:hypothetical protein
MDQSLDHKWTKEMDHFGPPVWTRIGPGWTSKLDHPCGPAGTAGQDSDIGAHGALPWPKLKGRKS